MKFVKGVFVVLGIVPVFAFGVIDTVFADSCTNCTGYPSAGRYCWKKGHKPKCPNGCYCYGQDEDSNRLAAICDDLHNKLADICLNKNPTSDQLQKMNKSGIYLCYENEPWSPERSSNYGQCEQSKKCSLDVVAGKFCAYRKGTGSSTPSNFASLCPNGCYCQGSSANQVAGVTYTDDFLENVFCKGNEVSAQTASVLNNAGIRKCPTGFRTNGSGKTSISDCGLYSIDGTLLLAYKSVECQSGQYLPKNSDVCVSCPSGKHCPGGTFYTSTQIDQVICDSPNDLWCRTVRGTHTGPMVIAGTTTVKTCVAGTYYSASDNDCVDCPAGYACAGGNFATGAPDKGKDDCLAGTYSAGNASECTACTGDNEYSDHNNATSCSYCETGTHPNAGHTDCDPDDAITCNALYVCDNGMGQINQVNNIPVGAFEVLSPVSFCNTPSDRTFGGWFINNTPLTEDTYTCTAQSSVLVFTAQWNPVDPDNPDNPNNTNTTGTYIHVSAGDYIPAGETEPVSCVNNSNISVTQFCPGGNWLTGQATPQGVFSCLPNGIANPDRKSCRVTLDAVDLTEGILDEGYCWLFDDVDEYRACVFYGATDAAQ